MFSGFGKTWLAINHTPCRQYVQKQLVTGITSTMGLILRDIVWRLKHVNAPKAGNIWKLEMEFEH